MLKHSYSAIKDFQGCGRRYHQVRILRRFKSEATEATMYGERVHKAFELYLTDGTPLPADLARHQPLLDKLAGKSREMYCERKLGVRADFTPCEFFDPDVWMRGIPDLLMLSRENGKAWIGDWKGLALDTKIPTPSGWTTMGEIKVGDYVFDARGEPTQVVGKSKVKHIPCYRVTFSDTTTVICDEEHLWKLTDGTAINVRELMGARNAKQRTYVPKIPVALPLSLPATELPVDPYVLGLWLADGTRSSGEISKPDAFVWEEIQRRGYAVDMTTGGRNPCPTRTVKGLRRGLRTLGLLAADKRIPAAYQRAGYEQRLDLLRGLMDGDGNANPTRQQAIFTSTSKVLSDDVMKLLCGLGQRPIQSTVTASGFGKTVPAYPISFRPVGINPFLLPRKASQVLDSWGLGKATYRYAVSVELIPSVPTQCIAVASPDHTFLCTERMIPTHNTGKSARFADTEQLELMAAMVMAHYPEINHVRGILAFVVAGTAVPAEYRREQLPEIWSKWAGRAEQILDAMRNDVWNASPSALCRFCPVSNEVCEHR